ncbi:MAG: HDIG domain-containing protein [Muribaculum sp.]|nr:HDIG domain-containing protein [Muribaculum sp.]
MSKIFNKHVVLRALLLIGCVALAVWLLPHKGTNAYYYELGKPWNYPLLTAPTDMPVYPDSITARNMRDSIDATFLPVYRRDFSIEKEAVAAFSNALNSQQSVALTHQQREQLISILKNALSDGIVEPSTYQNIRSGRLPYVRFIVDNISARRSTESFMSPKQAYAHIDSLFSDETYRNTLAATGFTQYLVPNILLDSVESNRLYADQIQKVMAPRGIIQQGERIIDRGDIVTPQLYSLLKTYEQIKSHSGDSQITIHHYPIAGEAGYALVIFGGLYLYLYFFRRKIFNTDRSVIFLMSSVTVFQLLACLLSQIFSMGLYMVPFTIVPILVIVFYDGRTAFFTFICEILLAAQISAYPFEFIFVQWAAGVVSICTLKEMRRRSQLIRAAFYILLTYAIVYAIIQIVQTGTLDNMSPRIFAVFAVNVIFISFAYVALFLVEKIFGFTSSVTLTELSDVNNKLLRRLSEECPGTFQHSMQVSNLASEAAHTVGANEQLVRTGALYHDIGKIDNPAFFTENQHGVNPHDALSPMQSARIVIDHVNNGMRMADKERLPEVIRDFITQHHGKGKAAYFYNTYCNAHPDEEVDVNAFTYPGPNPQTREASILMMADAVEAASRSLHDNSSEAIKQLVNRIIDGQIAAGLHNESNISFRDVTMIKKTFIDRLRTMYHARISYPKLNTEKN